MRRFALTLALMAACMIAAGHSDVAHRVGLNVRPAALTRHHEFFRGENPTGEPLRAATAAHLQYAFQFPSASRLGRLMPTAYQGIGVGGYTFFDHADVGTPATVYIFQGAQIAQFGEKLTLDYEWNFGVSAGWHPNIVTGTKINAYINAGLLLSWHPTQNWILSAGLDMSHFSNGDTTLPNVGVNTIGARIGAVRTFSDEVRKQKRLLDSAKIPFKQRFSLDVVACGSVNVENLTYQGKDYNLDGKFAVVGLHVNPLYRLSRNFRIGAALDVQYNEGVNLVDNVAGVHPVTGEIKFHRPHISEQLAAGVSLRAELQAPIFSINLGFGHNVIYNGAEQGGFYNIAALKTFLNDALFLHVGLKVNYTESSNNLLLGLGWRFGH